MRAGLAAAALAALSLAAPAAAQPTGAEVLRGAAETLARSHGPDVRDYAFTLVHGTVRTPVYVERGEEEWKAHTPEDTPLGDLMGMAVIWPMFVAVSDDPGEMEGVEDTRYLRTEQVEGRTAHVVGAAFPGEVATEGMDSVVVYVDAENGRLLRVQASGTLPEGEGGPVAGGDIAVTVDMQEHAETDGVTLPRRVRMRMAVQMPEMGPADRAQLTMGIAMLRAQLQGSDDPEAREMLAAMELFSALLSAGELDLPMTVEGVVVNAGPPAWLGEP